MPLCPPNGFVDHSKTCAHIELAKMSCQDFFDLAAEVDVVILSFQVCIIPGAVHYSVYLALVCFPGSVVLSYTVQSTVVVVPLLRGP